MPKFATVTLIYVIAIGAIATMFSGGALATTYNCTAVDDKAVLDINSSSVSTTTSRKVCKFSVDGATSSSSSTQSNRQSLNSLLAGDFDSLSRNRTIKMRSFSSWWVLSNLRTSFKVKESRSSIRLLQSCPMLALASQERGRTTPSRLSAPTASSAEYSGQTSDRDYQGRRQWDASKCCRLRNFSRFT